MERESLKTKAPKRAMSPKGGAREQQPSSLKIKKILVPLDLSLMSSHAALRFTMPLVRGFRAELHLVHVFPRKSVPPEMTILPIVSSQAETGARIRRNLKSIAETQGIESGVAHLHARAGRDAAEICSLARKLKIDLIVMATRGNTGLKHLTIGSTAERVVRGSLSPVLVIKHPQEMANTNGNGKRPDRPLRLRQILVPTDFSDCSFTGETYARQFAKEFGSNLTLVHSIPIPYLSTADEYARTDFPLIIKRSEEAARGEMREKVAKTRRENVKVKSSILIGHPGQQICACAERDAVDLIIIATHGYTGLKHLLLGSTTEYVLRHSTCPVLVVHSIFDGALRRAPEAALKGL